MKKLAIILGILVLVILIVLIVVPIFFKPQIVKMVKEKGANKVYSACVHPLLIGDSLKRIIENGAEEIIGTDAVESKVSKVSIAPLIGNTLTQ